MDGATPGPDDGRRTRRKEVTNPIRPRVLVGNLDTGGAAEDALLSHVSGPILRAGTCGMHLSEGRSGHATWHNARAVKLRNAHLAVVDRGKILDYLLNDAHPDNGGKARFFASLGFSREDPDSRHTLKRAAGSWSERFGLSTAVETPRGS